jgi:hypothetical protein
MSKDVVNSLIQDVKITEVVDKNFEKKYVAERTAEFHQLIDFVKATHAKDPKFRSLPTQKQTEYVLRNLPSFKDFQMKCSVPANYLVGMGMHSTKAFHDYMKLHITNMKKRKQKLSKEQRMRIFCSQEAHYMQYMTAHFLEMDKIGSYTENKKHPESMASYKETYTSLMKDQEEFEENYKKSEKVVKTRDELIEMERVKEFRELLLKNLGNLDGEDRDRIRAKLRGMVLVRNRKLLLEEMNKCMNPDSGDGFILAGEGTEKSSQNSGSSVETSGTDTSESKFATPASTKFASPPAALTESVWEALKEQEDFKKADSLMWRNYWNIFNHEKNEDAELISALRKADAAAAKAMFLCDKYDKYYNENKNKEYHTVTKPANKNSNSEKKGLNTDKKDKTESFEDPVEEKDEIKFLKKYITEEEYVSEKNRLKKDWNIAKNTYQMYNKQYKPYRNKLMQLSTGYRTWAKRRSMLFRKEFLAQYTARYSASKNISNRRNIAYKRKWVYVE